MLLALQGVHFPEKKVCYVTSFESRALVDIGVLRCSHRLHLHCGPYSVTLHQDVVRDPSHMVDSFPILFQAPLLPTYEDNKQISLTLTIAWKVVTKLK